MRSSIHIKLILFCLPWLMFSCIKEVEDTNLPFRKDVPILLATRVKSYTLSEVDFSFDLAVFKGDNETSAISEFINLPDSSFKFSDFEFSGTWVRHTIVKSVYTDTIPKSSFLTMILVDQSINPENFDSTDYYNQRYQAFNGFYKTLEGQGKVIFASYRRTGNTRDVLQVLNQEPSDRWDASIAGSLLDQSHNQGGTSGLFDAIEQSINLLSKFDSDNKSITLFLRNKDDGLSRLNLAGIISLANQNSVKVNVIWLIKDYNNVDFDALRQLPAKTGGFSVYMGSIYQSSSVFLGLSKILKLEMNFYRVDVKMTIGAPNYFQTKYSTGFYLYYYPPSFYIWNWIPIYLEKPV